MGVGSLTLVALTAFAANSVLCRAALGEATIDAASFSALRLLSGALTLWLLVTLRRGPTTLGGSWTSATYLFRFLSRIAATLAGLMADKPRIVSNLRG